MSLVRSSSSTDEDLEALVELFFRERFSTDNPIITEAVKRMLRAGGKRLRPRITLLSAAACGGNPIDHLHLAAYMELIHVATLIHDDVVDNAQTRRGVNATAVDYGNRVSVLAGDYLFAWIFKNVTLNYPHPSPTCSRQRWLKSATERCYSCKRSAISTLRSRPTLKSRVRRRRPVAASAQCGAIMGGAGAADIAALRAFGEAFGIAFQMKDDLLDVTADERSLGKPAANDLVERKTTIPLIAALASGDGDFRAEVRRFYEEGRNDAIPEVVLGIEREGGLRATRAQIALYVELAKQALEPITASAAKKDLAQLTDALLY